MRGRARWAALPRALPVQSWGTFLNRYRVLKFHSFVIRNTFPRSEMIVAPNALETRETSGIVARPSAVAPSQLSQHLYTTLTLFIHRAISVSLICMSPPVTPSFFSMRQIMSSIM